MSFITDDKELLNKLLSELALELSALFFRGFVVFDGHEGFNMHALIQNELDQGEGNSILGHHIFR